MSTKKTMAALADSDFDLDRFDTIGQSMAPTAAPEPEPDVKPELKQLSFRIPVELYKRWKVAMVDADEKQETIFTRLLTEELDRLNS